MSTTTAAEPQEQAPPPIAAEPATAGDDRYVIGFLQRHDPLVLVVAMALFAAGAFAYKLTTTPETSRFNQHGLSFDMPDLAWLPPAQLPPPPARLLHGILPARARQHERLHERYTSAADPNVEIEILVTHRPELSNLRAVLSFERRSRYGELYQEYATRVVSAQGKRWLRTRFVYASKPTKSAGPRVKTGIELATLNGKLLYVVTAHGTRDSAQWLAEQLAPTLAIDPTEPGAGSSADQRTSARALVEPAPAVGRSAIVDAGLPATVMVMAVDLIGGRLRPVSSGSGVIITSDGHVLTNYHVIHDEARDQLHDFFVIGRYRAPNRKPELVCAGEPDRAQLERRRDLALIRCDRDMDGHAWSPSHWPTLPFSLSEQASIDDTVSVLGYPQLTAGREGVATGRVAAIPGSRGDDYLHLSAAITDGYSGGPVIDEHGRLIGVAAASHREGGLAIPIARAVDLIVMTQQFDSDTTHQDGVSVTGRIVDMANGRPIANAVALVFREGISAADMDVDAIRRDVLAWGVTDDDGRFVLSRSLPRGSGYSAAFVAGGYRSIGPKRLRIEPRGPRQVEPWSVIRLRRSD